MQYLLMSVASYCQCCLMFTGPGQNLRKLVTKRNPTLLDCCLHLACQPVSRHPAPVGSLPARHQYPLSTSPLRQSHPNGMERVNGCCQMCSRQQRHYQAASSSWTRWTPLPHPGSVSCFLCVASSSIPRGLVECGCGMLAGLLSR